MTDDRRLILTALQQVVVAASAQAVLPAMVPGMLYQRELALQCVHPQVGGGTGGEGRHVRM